MKKYFITGLVTLLPVALTLAVVITIFNLLTGPFVHLFSATLIEFQVVPADFSLENTSLAFRLFCQLLVLVVLTALTILLGALMRWFFMHTLVAWGDQLLHSIPVIRSVYKACQDVVKTIFSSKAGAFKHVVMVPFPRSGSYAIGLITSETIKTLQQQTGGELVAVFMPTAPNPTSGYLVLYKPEDLIYLDMKIEEAFKFVVSCGVIATPLTSVDKDHAPPARWQDGNIDDF